MGKGRTAILFTGRGECVCVIEEGGREEGMRVWDEPRPFFDLIKECYPSWYCGQGKNGDPSYWER